MTDLLPLLQAAAQETGYGHFPWIGGRGAVWIAAEVHLMFAAFVLGVPMFAVITELIGIASKDSKYDKLSKEFTRLLVFAYSATALWGSVLLFFLTTLYPRFWGHMSTVFGRSMWVYAGLFFIESFTLYLYYYEGESVKSVARALGVSRTGVKNRLRRGRDLLREKLWREFGDCLRDMLPSTRDWQRGARRLTLAQHTRLG